jgi:predicted dehydrogenase
VTATTDTTARAVDVPGTPSQRPLRAAIVGGHRGGGYGRAFDALRERITLTAICDLDADVVAGWKETRPELRGYTRYEDLLDADACDAVMLATPMQLHARQAIQALRAGKHVLSEVIAATTLEDCWALVEAVAQTGRVYMLAENYTYMRPNMMVRRMTEAGVFGTVYYAEGAYIHDCRHLGFDPNGELTWRGEISREAPGNLYPTHSLGPVAQWLGCAGPNAHDRLAEVACFTTPDLARHAYARERFGAGHPAATGGFYRKGDSATTILTTSRGSVADVRVDANSPRPHNMTHYHLQGTQAAYLSGRYREEDPLIWISGRTTRENGTAGGWQPLWDYADEFEHPYWREHGATAREAGHGGGDYFIIEDFVRAIAGGVSPAIDVYDAVAWSSVYPLSMESAAQGGRPVAIADFRRGARST